MNQYIRLSVKSTSHLFIVLASSVSDASVMLPSELSSSITFLLHLRRRLSEDVTDLSSDNTLLHLSISRVVKATLSLSFKSLVM